MTSAGEIIKRLLPESILPAAREIHDRILGLPEEVSASTHPWRLDSIRRLARLQDSHRGDRCFIIGNGPSLQKTDLNRLRGEFTIGMNRIYMLFPQLGFPTSYYLSINDLVIEQCSEDIQRLPIPKFLSWHSRRWVQPADDLFFLYTTYTRPKFTKNLTGRLWEGATVTYVAMQLAFFLGFSTVILIGVDHNFVTQGKPNTTVVSQGDDPNHFHPGYFGKGFRWQLPDLETSEIAYKMAGDVYLQDGRQILDATVEGKLRIFPKVEYDTLF